MKLLALALVLAAACAKAAPAPTAITCPNGVKVHAEVVATPESRERGLMFRKKLAKDYGMLFVFPQERPLSFWMKNTWVSLDMAFIAADKTVARLHRGVKPSTPKTTDAEVARAGGTGLYVLELPAGGAKRCGLEEGSRLSFSAAIPLN